jgi:hypothetical protein
VLHKHVDDEKGVTKVTSVDVWITGEIADELTFAFIRLDDNPRIIFQIKISDAWDRKICPYRLGVVFFDDVAEIDFCGSKENYNLDMQLLGSSNSFSYEPNCVSGVVWHGMINEGSGVIGKLLKASEVMIRVYLDDYTSKEFALEIQALDSLKKCVTAEILGLQ